MSSDYKPTWQPKPLPAATDEDLAGYEKYNRRVKFLRIALFVISPVGLAADLPAYIAGDINAVTGWGAPLLMLAHMAGFGLCLMAAAEFHFGSFMAIGVMGLFLPWLSFIVALQAPPPLRKWTEMTPKDREAYGRKLWSLLVRGSIPMEGIAKCDSCGIPLPRQSASQLFARDWPEKADAETLKYMSNALLSINAFLRTVVGLLGTVNPFRTDWGKGSKDFVAATNWARSHLSDYHLRRCLSCEKDVCPTCLPGTTDRPGCVLCETDPAQSTTPAECP